MLEKLTVSYQRFTLIDIHESMSWWACFQPDEAPRPEPDLSHPFTDMPGKMSTKAQQKDSKAAKKKKRKQAKASRKKNRRR
jgi:hypothetical protein